MCCLFLGYKNKILVAIVVEVKNICTFAKLINLKSVITKKLTIIKII